MLRFLKYVILAKAGIHFTAGARIQMDSRLRRNDKLLKLACLALLCVFPVLPAHAIDFKARQIKLVDETTHTVLLEHEADTKMAPSSMSKLMTLYVLFDKLKQGGITLESPFTVSEKAWRMQGSKMFVQVGTQVKVEDLIHGIIVQSGNDACVVIAEGLGGSEEGFAKMMNDMAAKIGLKNSHFVNSTGWPDENHYMTANDLVTLSEHIINDFPEYYPFFALDSFTYNNITQPNRNLLLSKDLGVDGLKTGHTEVAGYGITLSAKKDGRRLILVMNGLSSMAERASEGETILRYGFREFEAVNLLQPGAALPNPLPVWFGTKESVVLTVAEPFSISLPRGEREKLKFIMKANSPVPAPIKSGDVLGQLEIRQADTVIRSVPIVASEDVAEAGFIDHLKKAVSYKLSQHSEAAPIPAVAEPAPAAVTPAAPTATPEESSPKN